MMFEPADLLAAAVEARDRAYAPYSGFCVGAAVVTPAGRVFTGENIENASYGLSMCAERVAVYNAVSAGERRFAAVAVTGPPGMPAMPCGACRQVLHEFGPSMHVIVPDRERLRIVPLTALLPEAFSGSDLAAVPDAVASSAVQREVR